MSRKPRPAFYGYRLSGYAARRWKNDIGMLAKRKKEIMRTLKFPLDIPEEAVNKLPLQMFENAYEAIEGVGEGTLFNYWARLHLAGFRFFSTGSEAAIFRQRVLFNDAEWNAEFCRQSGKEWPWLLPSKLYERFTKLPRTVTKADGSKKSVTFVPENVAAELHKFFFGSVMNDKTPEDHRLFFEALALALAEQFSSWQEANAQPAQALRVIDAFFQSGRMKLPSLEQIASRITEVRPPNATIAWHDEPDTSTDSAHFLHAIYARCASRYGKEPDTGIGKFVQEHATTPNVNALAWLFGNGLDYFQSASTEQIMEDFAIPDTARQAILKLQYAANDIPAPQVFNKKNYSPFRSIFGAKLDSWIANYTNRLLLLTDALGTIEPGFALPEGVYQNETLNAGIDMSPEQLRLLIGAVYSNVDAAQAALQILLGQTQRDAGFDTVTAAFEQFTSVLDTLHGTLRTIEARYQRALDIVHTDPLAVEKLVECKFEIPGWVKPVPKLLAISGGLPDVHLEISNLNGTYRQVREKMFNRLAEIEAYIKGRGEHIDIYAQLEARELAALRKLKAPEPERAQLQARRDVLHRIGRAIQNCSEPTKQRFSARVRALGVFENSAFLNTFIFNQKGAIYRSPFDRARNSQYRLRADVLLKTDWLGLLQEILQELMADTTVRAREDASRLERTFLSLKLSGIPHMDYPPSLATPDIEVEIPATLALQLTKETVGADIVAKAFSLYSAVLYGLTFRLMRRAFTVKMRFAMAEDTQLIYTSKDREWKIPRQYYIANGKLGDAVRVVKSTVPEQMIDEVRKAACDANDFMLQAPHDWYFDACIGGETKSGRAVAKSTVGTLRNFTAYRLKGAPSYKSVLDRTLIGTTNVGQSSIIIEVPYTQTLNADFEASIQMGSPKVSVAIPVTEQFGEDEKDESLLYNRFCAIDLGEYGIGYAVFDSRTFERLDSGFYPIPKIKHLLNRTKRYEQRPNERQKFQNRFNINLSELRKDTVGQVCNAMNRICGFYGAFPVLEYMVTDKLNKQLKSVYETVLNRYIWSPVKAHELERETFWLGAKQWQHPYLVSLKDKKPLTLAPGRSVSSKGNSQRCSHCQRNAFDLISALKPKDKIAIVEGQAVIEGHTLRLQDFGRESPTQSQARRRRHERREMDRELASGNYTVDELRTILRRNIRRAPHNTQTRDSTVSRYHCVFADCGHVMHADENAAINAGEKFMGEVSVSEPAETAA